MTTEAVVIGGGVVGCSVLRSLAMQGVEAILVEAEQDIGEGTSKANSAILHTGFDAKPGSVEADMLRRSRDMWPSLLSELAVPSLRCGAVMLAMARDDVDRLREIAAVSTGHRVETELVDRGWLREAAPFVTEDAVAALHIPDESIVDPFWLTRAYAELAMRLGAQVWAGAPVIGIDVGGDAVEIRLGDGRRLRATQAFDCAGLKADEVARLADDTSFAIRPRKGQFLVSERTYEVDRIVLPIPGPLGKGMLVTPIVFGGVLLGPTAEDGDDKTDRSTNEDGRRRIVEACRRLVPDVDRMDPIRSFAGLRAVSSTGDFIMRPSTAGDRLMIVAGIRSTRISASPAIGEAAVAMAATARGWASRGSTRTTAATGPELAADSGPVVCVCRSVGAAEVAAALDGPMLVTTTDGLKRRCGVGFGDCQGNRCLAEALERTAAARSVDPTAIEKGLAGSWILADGGHRQTRPTDSGEGSAARRVPKPAPDGVAQADLAIVGGGMAAIGAAVAAVAAGLDVVVIDRGRQPGGALAGIAPTRWTDDEREAVATLGDLRGDDRLRWWPESTVIGLAGDGMGWQIDTLSGAGPATIAASKVLLATGGYLTPREHLAIDGPRPSGVMTGDFVVDALDRGWLPARTVVLVGDGRLARGIADRMVAAGIAIVERVASAADGAVDQRTLPVRALRGERRLEAVQIGDRWVAADGLVLAHALRPATFLIRGLGIGDDRPGVPMPVDDYGALPRPGLHAVGTCVRPTVDHEGSVAAGAAVVRAVRSSFAAPTGEASVLTVDGGTRR